MEISALVFLNSSSDPGEMRLGGAGSGGRSRGPGLCWAGQVPSHPWSRELMSPDVISWTPGQYLRPSELVLCKNNNINIFIIDICQIIMIMIL